MRTSVSIWAMVLSAVTAASPLYAQDSHAAPQAALDAAVQEHAAANATDREAVQRVLERAEVKAVADRVGIDVRQASTAMATLDAADLAQLATEARRVEQALAGGQSSITISTTLIIIGLLVLILIIVAV